MTIAQAFNEIAIAQGGTPNNGGTIAGAIDALNDALAGSDQAQGRTIEDAVRLLGAHIGGGSSVTVESLTATENKTYTAPEGKAYSPVTVNVSGAGGTEYTITYYDSVNEQPLEDIHELFVATYEQGQWIIPEDANSVNKAAGGTPLLFALNDYGLDTVFYSGEGATEIVPYITDNTYSEYGLPYFNMPNHDIIVAVTTD